MSKDAERSPRSALVALEVDDDPREWEGAQIRRVISSSSFATRNALVHEEGERISRRERRSATIKYLMLLCACTLSLGSCVRFLARTPLGR